MKSYIEYIPLTAFAAAIVLGGSLSAAEADSEGTSMREQQRQNQQPARTNDETATERTTEHANLRPTMASEVIGMNIDSADNEKIGEIDEVYIDSETGEVLAMVVATGGFLGIGQQQSLISPEDLRLNAERTHFQTDITRDQIRSAPGYTEGETTGFDQIRPLGATASDWEERRAQRTNRTEIGQDVTDRQTTGQERADRTGDQQNVTDRQTAGQERADRTEDQQDVTDRQATRQERADRTEDQQNVTDRQTTGQERTQRTDRSEGGQSQGRSLAVSELMDLSVENRQGEAVGDVEEVYLDIENWEVVGVVVSTGGFLGIGDRKTLFGLQEMSFDPSNETALLDYNRDQISEFPEFEADDQSVFENLLERMERLGSPRSTTSAAVQQ